MTNEVRYVYDGNLEIQWRDGNNLPTLTLTRGRDLSGSLQGGGGIGGMLARTDAASGQTAYFHADGNEEKVSVPAIVEFWLDWKGVMAIRQLRKGVTNFFDIVKMAYLAS